MRCDFCQNYLSSLGRCKFCHFEYEESVIKDDWDILDLDEEDGWEHEQILNRLHSKDIDCVMADIYFTIAGANHYYGTEFLEPDMKVKLVKEPDNEVDKEAIRVEMPGLAQIGYVANSPYTVIGESYSAGRLYDKFGNNADGVILHILPNGVLCKLIVEE